LIEQLNLKKLKEKKNYKLLKTMPKSFKILNEKKFIEKLLKKEIKISMKKRKVRPFGNLRKLN
jgi:putative transposon-encoded protein